MAPKVSICVPTYNRRDYLRETLHSALGQTYKDREIVVVDDGSTDGTDAMVKSLEGNIRYCWQANAGDAAARNKLIQLARGRFITFIDSDDLLVNDAVDRMLTTMEREGGNVVVYGPYIRIDEQGKACGRCHRKLRSGHITPYLFENMLVHSCGSMFPRQALEALNGFDSSLRVCSDYDLWLRLSLKYRFIALTDPTFMRRRHGGNLSRGASIENAMTELQVLERFYYERGGVDAVPPRAAIRRLSRERYRVARCALQQREYTLAIDFFRKSLSDTANLKATFGLLIALLRSRLRT